MATNSKAKQTTAAAKPAGKQVSAPAAAPSSMVLVQDQVPDYLQKDSPARGNENVTIDDITIPRLDIVQALSPEVKEGDPKYREEARPGMLVNSVTGQLYGKEVFVILVYYTKQWLVWKKRKTDDGKALEGGFFGAYPSPEEAKDRMEQEGGAANHIEIIDTPQHFALILNKDTGKTEEVVISMPRTKAKVSRNINAMIKLTGRDRFASVIRLGTQLEKNAKGDFYNFAPSLCGFPAMPLFKKAEELYNAMAAGDRRVVMDVSGFDAGTGTGGGDDAEM